MLDSFTQFWFSHLDGIVNVLFLVLILLFLVLFVIIFISSRNKKSLTGAETNDLETTLRKVLESAELKASPGSMPAGNAAASAEAVAEVAKLKKSVGEKVAEIEVLKKQIAEKKDSGSEADANALQVRLKELEAKLAEYEIIEDDIANLSMYKEENKRLRSELDKLQAGGAPTPISEAVTPPEPTPEPAAVVPEPVVEVAPEPIPEPVAEIAPQTIEASAAVIPEGNDDDIMGEFVQAVAEQGTKENPIPPPVEASAAPAEEAPVIEKAPPAPVVEDTDDIMAEFEAAAAKIDTGQSKPEVDKSVDENVKAEFEAAVVEKEKVNPADEVAAKATALDENTDTDKILNEMDTLLNTPVAAGEEDKDPTEKLIGEFESLTDTKS